MDRNTIAQARLNDLEDDLGMTGTDFNTAVSVLFVGCESPGQVEGETTSFSLL